MIRDMFVWRKSIYDNDFKCNQCGAKLFNTKTKKPTDNLVVDADAKTEEDKSFCFCGKCHNVVAKWQEVEVSDDESENVLKGSYSEWLEKKAMDMKAEMQKKVEERLEKKYAVQIQMLNDSIKSKDASIKKLKQLQQAQNSYKDEKIMGLERELEHANSQIEKLKGQIEKCLDKELGIK